MKTMIITSILALSTGLTGVLGAPVAIANSDLTARGDTKYGSVVSGGNDAISVAARDEEKHTHKPYCNEPLCYPVPLPPKEKRDDNAAPVEDVITERDENAVSVEDVIAERDDDKKGKPKKPKHPNPYWCGAPFCGPEPVKAVRELESSPSEKRSEDIITGRDNNAVPVEEVITERDNNAVAAEDVITERDQERKKPKHHDPYWCGAPFCGPKPKVARELESSPSEKRSVSIVKCWQGPEGQVHCANPPYPPRSDAGLSERGEEITKCWEASDGQVHCRYSTREAESVVDTNE